ncbi:MAG: glycosyltransferase family 9 protein [Verrucomicrobia bacterium]|jgi:ADP-heptose:LPS heptosyltransferase|nr:glycosyltransferase family 9 protein [Verrucomicrobiota bacterium]
MKLLVISLAGIGDTLFATPLIHELRENFPDATLDAFVLWRGARDLLAGNPHLNHVHQHNLMAEPKTAALKFLLSLRPERYDVSINTHPQSRVHYRLVAHIIGADMRLSHKYDHASPLDRLLVNRSLPQDYARHSIENNLALLELLGAKRRLPRHDYEIFLTPAEHAWADGFLVEKKLSGRKLLGIHVGSGGTKNLALRRWPLAHYIQIIQKLIRTCPEVAILLFGGPEEENDIARVLAEGNSSHVFHPETKDLRQVAALVKHCTAFLSVDTALMHIAAAMKVARQIVIETPTWNKPVEPHGNPFTLVKNPAVAGRNLEFYRYDGRGIRGTDEELARCMASVTVEAVFEAVTRALG